MFRVRPFEARTLNWWYSRRRQIDMEPPYQRKGGLWDPRDKSYLIDSILNDYDIPKVYVADFTYVDTPLNLHRLPYAVIDGKQRFEAIFDFFDGNITLGSDFSYDEDPTLNLGGIAYNDLKKSYPEIADKFENFNLTVMSVITDDEAKINALFVRLNTNRPLSGAELRNAKAGLVPQLIRRVADHRFFKENIRFGTKRGQDRNLAAKLLLLEFRGEIVDLKKKQLDQLAEEGVRADAQTVDLERAATRTEGILNRMCDVFIQKDPLLSSQGPIPLYYWVVRSLPEEARGKLRPFLVRLEQTRKENRQLAGRPERPTEPNATLLLYDTLDRSPNDASSIETRFRLLSSFFSRYLDHGWDPEFVVPAQQQSGTAA